MVELPIFKKSLTFSILWGFGLNYFRLSPLGEKILKILPQMLS
jgi:hypothetical protein